MMNEKGSSLLLLLVNIFKNNKGKHIILVVVVVVVDGTRIVYYKVYVRWLKNEILRVIKITNKKTKKKCSYWKRIVIIGICEP